METLENIPTRSYKDDVYGIGSPKYGRQEQGWRHISYWSSKTPQKAIGGLAYSILNSEISVGARVYYVPFQLSAILQQITEAKELLKYKDNWDESGAKATDLDTFSKAIDFLVKYSSYILNTYRVVLKTPYIDLLPDGSVYIQWETNKAKFLIVFKREQNQDSYFYAERKDSGIAIKSYIRNYSNSIDETVSFWMKSNLA